MDNIETLLNSVVQIARLAGKELLKLYRLNQNLEIKTKEDGSPVTLADYTAHEIISKELTVLTPDIPLLSEEGERVSYENRKQWHRFWLVDPLDGTREFIHQSGQFTVNIALIENSVPILGVIYVPLKDECYFAAQGLGSHKINADGVLQNLKIRSWQIGDEIVLVATRRELHENLQAELEQFGRLKITYRSSSLKFCLIAEAEGDLYLRKKPIHEWDTGAGQCILEQAGGIVLDLNWNPLLYNTKPHLRSLPFIALGDSKQLLAILRKMPVF